MRHVQPGDLLAGRYRLRNVIGRGGMGVVWLAADGLLNRDVAIKETVRPPQLDDSEWDALRERSLREARTAAGLNHPGIVSIFDVLEEEGRPWMVMQLVPFPSLGDLVRASGPLSPAATAQVGLQILAAIRAAHAAGVLHRDVKPANVLVGQDGEVVLTDFGLAVADGSPHVTMAGQVIGSPAFMSPECARGEPAMPASDLWSLGATLYAAVEGRAPFERDGMIAVLTAIASDSPAAPSRAGQLWPVINGLLCKDPRDRLDADTTEHMLHRVAASAGPVAEAAVLPVPATVAVSEADQLRADTRQFDAGSSLAGPAVSTAGAAGTHGRPRRSPASAWLAGAVLGALAIVAIVLIGAYLAPGSAAGRHLTTPPSTTHPASPLVRSRTGPASASAAGRQHHHAPACRHRHRGKDNHHGNGNGQGDGGDDG